jgi:hypothetical protein
MCSGMPLHIPEKLSDKHSSSLDHMGPSEGLPFYIQMAPPWPSLFDCSNLITFFAPLLIVKDQGPLPVMP